jgi:hypothetical protein
MTYQVTVGPEAAREIQEAFDWYEERSEGLGLEFLRAEDVKQEEIFDEVEEEEESEGSQEGNRKPKFSPVTFHDACIRRIESYLEQPLIKHSKASYSSADGEIALICAISKEHSKNGQQSYWFAFHPHQQDFLEAADRAFVSLGCGSAQAIVVILYSEFSAWLEGMNITSNEERFYWHISIFRENERLVLHRKRGQEKIDLSKYII